MVKNKILAICIFLYSLSSVCFAYDSVNLRTIAYIESGNNAKAYNEQTKATGLYQITPICLADYNYFAKAGQYTLSDMFDVYRAKLVATWYIEKRIPFLLKKYNHEVTVRNVLIGFNCGVKCVGKPLPKETSDYIKKYDMIENN